MTKVRKFLETINDVKKCPAVLLDEHEALDKIMRAYIDCEFELLEILVEHDENQED